jgi:hypothetical protein
VCHGNRGVVVASNRPEGVQRSRHHTGMNVRRGEEKVDWSRLTLARGLNPKFLDSFVVAVVVAAAVVVVVAAAAVAAVAVVVVVAVAAVVAVVEVFAVCLMSTIVYTSL